MIDFLLQEENCNLVLLKVFLVNSDNNKFLFYPSHCLKLKQFDSFVLLSAFKKTFQINKSEKLVHLQELGGEKILDAAVL